ncbi:MAG: hypothetical protein DMG69_27740 [Acidobacteria bacterium]|nr:MAG: hypothetical protein DMG69_27740 [Acidobacteriota bacterium]
MNVLTGRYGKRFSEPPASRIFQSIGKPNSRRLRSVFVAIWLPFGAGGDEISTSWEKPIPKQGQIMLMPIYC